MGLSAKQAQILLFPKTEYEALICDGAVRSGKTSIMSLSFVLWAMTYFDRCNFALCGKTVQSTTRNLIVPLQGLTYFKKYGYVVKWSCTKHLLTISRGQRINWFYVFGGKDEGSSALIQGMTLGGVMFDEVALMPRSFVEQALARCSIEGARFWFNCNPESPSHWFYQEWILDTEKKHNSMHLHFLMEDNPSLSAKILQRYKTMYTGVFYERFILGRWRVADGLIYRAVADNPSSFEVNKKDLPTLNYINIGVDFGGNKSQHAFTAVGLTRSMDTLYVLRAKSLPAKDTNVEYIIKEFLKFANSIKNDFGFVDAVYADSAEQAIINSMRRATPYAIVSSIKNQIIDRIRCEDILISSKRLYFVVDENIDLIEGMTNAVWDPDEIDDIRLDDGTSNIDILDSFEYAFEPFIRELIDAG